MQRQTMDKPVMNSEEKSFIALCEAINGNRITLSFDDKILEFDTDEPQYFEVGKQYEMKDDMEITSMKIIDEQKQ